jgi:short-subunit dehydrogenase
MTELQNAVILITGANGGFGQEMMRQFLQANGRLIVTDLNKETLAQTVHAIQNEVTTGEVVACLAADLSTAVGCQQLHEAVQALNLPVDILVNNAGLAAFGRFDEVPQEKWEMIMQINLLAPMRLCHHFIPGMVARGKGHIVNISSMAGWMGAKGLATYSASKHGLRGFSESLMDELEAYGVEVTAVYPFYSRTPILDSPRFGSLSGVTLPDDMLSEPADVIREVVQGIQKNQQHVFPDKTAKQMHILKRYAPKLLDFLNGRALAQAEQT